MKKPDFRLWDGKKMRYNAIVGNGQALYIPDGLGEYKWVNLAEVVAMEKTDFVDEDRKVIYESDILEDKEGNIGAVVWIKEWGMFGVLVGDEFEDYINGGVKKAISIKQPWASLIAHGIKNIENRTWKTNFRGRIYIHASGKFAGDINTLFSDEQWNIMGEEMR